MKKYNPQEPSNGLSCAKADKKHERACRFPHANDNPYVGMCKLWEEK
jgi:hypothetical protein